MESAESKWKGRVSELDTDLRSAERLAGTPVVGLKGVAVGTQNLTIRPGVVWPLGENGAMASLDLSHSVETLLAALTDKLDRQLIKHKEKVKGKKQGLVGR